MIITINCKFGGTMKNQFINSGLDNRIAQTLLIPLYMKSVQSKKSGTFFTDTLACEPVNKLGIDFSVFDSAKKNLLDCGLDGRYQRLKQKHPNSTFLFLIEGVFMYFEKRMLKDFLTQLCQRFSQSELVFDATSQWMCNRSDRHDSIKHTAAKFKLALGNSQEIETWVPNLIMKLIPQMKKASYIVHVCIK